MNERPETYEELRKMIRIAKKVYVSTIFNNGSDIGNTYGDPLSVPISKKYALSLYEGLTGVYYSDNGGTAFYDDIYNTLHIS